MDVRGHIHNKCGAVYFCKVSLIAVVNMAGNTKCRHCCVFLILIPEDTALPVQRGT